MSHLNVYLRSSSSSDVRRYRWANPLCPFSEGSRIIGRRVSPCSVSQEYRQCCQNARSQACIMKPHVRRIRYVIHTAPRTRTLRQLHHLPPGNHSYNARSSRPQSAAPLDTPATTALVVHVKGSRVRSVRRPGEAVAAALEPTEHRPSAAGRTLPPPVSINCIDLRWANGVSHDHNRPDYSQPP